MPDFTGTGRIHFSRLKLVAKSLAHYRANPSTVTDDLLLGRAIHSYLLGDQNKVVVYDGIRNGKHKKYQEFKEANRGKVILTAREMRVAEGMSRSLDGEREARNLLQGHREEYLEWEVDGHRCAGTPDVWGQQGVVELKKTSDGSQRAFQRGAESYGYHAQLTWYRFGLASRMLVPADAPLTIVAIEDTEPYAVSLHRLDRGVQEDGEALWRGWLEQVEKAEALGYWPAYEPCSWERKRSGTTVAF